MKSHRRSSLSCAAERDTWRPFAFVQHGRSCQADECCGIATRVLGSSSLRRRHPSPLVPRAFPDTAVNTTSRSKHGSDASSAFDCGRTRTRFREISVTTIGRTETSTEHIHVQGRPSAARCESALARPRSAARGATSDVEGSGFPLAIREACAEREPAQATSATPWRARAAAALPRFAKAVAGVARRVRSAGAFTLDGAQSRPCRSWNADQKPGQFAGASPAQTREALV
jgi:hypothetical protein